MKQNELSKNSKSSFDKLVIDIEKNGNFFFEIKSEITNDISEAVAIMMSDKCFDNHDVWNTPIPKNITSCDIDTEKTIYWLTGGNNSWVNKNGMYTVKWIEIANDYDYMVGEEIKELFNDSKTFGELRDKFKLSFPMIRILDLAIFLNIL